MNNIEIQELKVTKKSLANIKVDHLNSLDLRSDLEGNRINKCTLKFEGYVGNRPTDFEGEYHEDDTWAIDVEYKGNVIESYLYTSEYEYEQDIKTLTKDQPNRDE